MKPGNPRAMSRIPRRTLLALGGLLLLATAVVIGCTREAAESGSAVEADSPTTQQYYTCGMHPWVLLPHPGDCPICHMKLTPVDPAKFSGEVTIDPVVVQNMGVRVEPVTEGPLTRTIRTVGSVTYDETRVRDINVKFGGWIERLRVNYLGADVRRGEILFSVYSPELYAAQQEYLVAQRSATTTGGKGPLTGLLASARKRLQYYDLSEAQIDALPAQGAQKAVPIVSPYPGVVVEKHANEGMRIDPGMLVYRIADLSRVWVIATVYEYQLPFVAMGQRGTMTLAYAPGRVYEGEVTYISPTVDEQAREVKVRLEFTNPDGSLKPGMFASVHLERTLADKRIQVPRAAVIDTGERQIAFVAHGKGRFEPRPVTMGIETEHGQVEIVEGLTAGEMVVTSGQFLLDSESRVREALAKMMRDNLASEPAAAPATPTLELPQVGREALATSIRSYLAIHDALATDKLDGVSASARMLGGALAALLAVEVPGSPHFWQEQKDASSLPQLAATLMSAGDLASARVALAPLSDALLPVIEKLGVPADLGFSVDKVHCPMYRADQGGASWLQRSGEARNPYYGAAMLGCFDDRSALFIAGAPQESSRSASPTTLKPPAAAGHTGHQH
ncbi:MAG: efflux RND transporter periplasmic adaptor subunit [Pseudomonadota bacterium]